MKKGILKLVLFGFAFLIFIVGCPKPGSGPSSPSGPSGTNTPTPVDSWTPCWTASPTPTGTPCQALPSPTNWIAGAVSYTGTGTVDSAHPLIINFLCTNYYYLSGDVYLASNSGAYTLGVPGNGIYSLTAYYNFNGLTNGLTNYYIAACSSGMVSPTAGERYTNGGTCASPVSVASYSVTVSSPAGATVVGPNITLDDSCSYEGFYGTVTYTGHRGLVQYCTPIWLRAYLDPGYTTPSPYYIQSSSNGFFYDILTNAGTSPTGLTPLYVRVWLGGAVTGSPYLNVGMVTPSANGAQLNINFDDTYLQ